MSDEQLGHKAIKGSVFIGAAQIFKILIQFISVVVLARLLVPEDFGLVASVSPLIVFLGLFQDFGLQQAVVQRKEISHAQLNTIFWLTILIGLVCALVLCLISPAVGAFYGDERIVFITVAVAGPLILNSILSLPLGLLNREMRFGMIAVIDVIAAALGLLVAIAAALSGFGYWALIMSPAASAAITLFGSWLFSGWKPAMPSIRLEREILSFGANLTGFNFVNFFARNLDNVLIGKFVGAQGLGFYDRAYKLMLFPIQNVSGPLSRIMVPVLSRVQDDDERFRAIYMRTIAALALFVMPGVGALVISAEETIRVLFGERWMAIVPIFAWLGLAGMVQPLTGSAGWVFIARAKTDVMFKWGVFASSTTIFAFFIGLPWGVVGVAMAYALSDMFVRMPLLFMVLSRHSPIKFFDVMIVMVPILLAISLAALVVHFVGGVMDVHDVVLIGMAIVLSYGFTLAAFVVHRDGRRLLSEIMAGGVKFIRGTRTV